jgi:hypothetical protein
MADAKQTREQKLNQTKPIRVRPNLPNNKMKQPQRSSPTEKAYAHYQDVSLTTEDRKNQPPILVSFFFFPSL